MENGRMETSERLKSLRAYLFCYSVPRQEESLEKSYHSEPSFGVIQSRAAHVDLADDEGHLFLFLFRFRFRFRFLFFASSKRRWRPEIRVMTTTDATLPSRSLLNS